MNSVLESESDRSEVRTWRLFLAGRIAQEEQRFSDALNFFEQVLAKEPAHPYARITTACVLANLGELDRARTLFDEAVMRFEYDPNPSIRARAAVALNNKALHHATRGYYDEAFKGYDQIVLKFASDPDHEIRRRAAAALREKAAVLDHIGRHREAHEARLEIVRRFRDDTQVPLHVFCSSELIFECVAKGELDVARAYHELAQQDLDAEGTWVDRLETLIRALPSHGDAI
jgi:tetratricopeptide (TPR) repeat protein